MFLLLEKLWVYQNNKKSLWSPCTQENVKVLSIQFSKSEEDKGLESSCKAPLDNNNGIITANSEANYRAPLLQKYTQGCLQKAPEDENQECTTSELTHLTLETRVESNISLT